MPEQLTGSYEFDSWSKIPPLGDASMDAAAKSCRRITTGLFEIDLGTGEVLRQGHRIPLQDQPFRVLSLLLERPGQVVTREELQSRLWPADTYVSFDEGLNTAIRKLRVVFGDSADNPRFIETVPRRGYRFIAPLSELPNGSNPLSSPAGSADLKNATVPSSSEQSRGQARPSIPYAGIWLLPAAAMIVLITVAMTHRLHRPPEAPPARRAMLAVLPYENLSNDPAQDYFSDGLTEETITDLGQLNPAQLGVIARTSAMAYKHKGKTASQIGRELGVDYILEGSVRRDGERARVSAQLIRVSDQTHLWAQSYDDQNIGSLLDVENAGGIRLLPEGPFLLEPENAGRQSRKY